MFKRGKFVSSQRRKSFPGKASLIHCKYTKHQTKYCV